MTSKDVLTKHLILMIEDNKKTYPNDASKRYKPLEQIETNHSYPYVLKSIEEFARIESNRVSESLVEVIMIMLDKIPEEILIELLGDDYDKLEKIIQNV